MSYVLSLDRINDALRTYAYGCISFVRRRGSRRPHFVRSVPERIINGPINGRTLEKSVNGIRQIADRVRGWKSIQDRAVVVSRDRSHDRWTLPARRVTPLKLPWRVSAPTQIFAYVIFVRVDIVHAGVACMHKCIKREQERGAFLAILPRAPPPPSSSYSWMNVACPPKLSFDLISLFSLAYFPFFRDEHVTRATCWRRSDEAGTNPSIIVFNWFNTKTIRSNELVTFYGNFIRLWHILLDTRVIFNEVY